MSTQYYFTDPDKDRRIEQFRTEVKEIGEKTRTLISALPIEDDLEELKDTLLWNLDHGHVFDVDAPDTDWLTIGSTRAGGFSWRHDNGFHTIWHVERYLNEHPNLTIVDEYGETFTLDKFKKIIQAWTT